MKSVSILAICLAILLASFSCSDKYEAVPMELGQDEVVTVRVSFVAVICGDAICKIEDPAYVGLGQQGFRYEGKTYDGAFLTRLPCGPNSEVFAAQSAESPATFTVKISKKQFSQVNYDCVRCMATFAEAPSAFYFISPE